MGNPKYVTLLIQTAIILMIAARVFFLFFSHLSPLPEMVNFGI